MGQADEPERDEQRLKRISKEAEQEQGKQYSLWDRLGRILVGRDSDQERRDYTTRKPDTK
jgi:hypothetical protein